MTKGDYSIKAHSEKDYLVRDRRLFKTLCCDFCDKEMKKIIGEWRVGLPRNGYHGDDTYVCDECWNEKAL